MVLYHFRYGWIDLSAGPFKWGPVIAGQGVRSLSTLPRVPPYYALHPEADPQRRSTIKLFDHVWFTHLLILVLTKVMMGRFSHRPAPGR